jgi:hypothetical protein
MSAAALSSSALLPIIWVVALLFATSFVVSVVLQRLRSVVVVCIDVCIIGHPSLGHPSPQCQRSSRRVRHLLYGPFPPTTSPQQHCPLHHHVPPQCRGPQPHVFHCTAPLVPDIIACRTATSPSNATAHDPRPLHHPLHCPPLPQQHRTAASPPNIQAASASSNAQPPTSPTTPLIASLHPPKHRVTAASYDATRDTILSRYGIFCGIFLLHTQLWDILYHPMHKNVGFFSHQPHPASHNPTQKTLAEVRYLHLHMVGFNTK